MALEPITRLEQIIAGKNLEPITRMEKFLKEYGGSGGGSSVQSDWNQTDSSAADFIKNKPFGDMPTGGDTLYWDGNTEGLVDVKDTFYKLSDAVLTDEQIKNATVTDSNGNSLAFADSFDQLVSAGMATEELVLTEAIVLCRKDGAAFANYVFPESGIYGVSNEICYTASITIPGYTGFPVTKKLDEKYLPGAVILYTDAEVEGYLYATSDTSDTSKRLTKAELLEILQSGKAVYCYYLDFIHALAVTFFDLGNWMSVVFFSDGECITAYTAEYALE